MPHRAALPTPEEEYAFENAALRCAACGSPAEAGTSFCAGCGAALPGEGPPSEPDGASPLTAGFECRSCGASVACEPGRSSYACAFCGSTYVVELAAGGLTALVPEFVIPFRIGREPARETFDRWCHQGLFTPGDVRQAARMDRLQGVYLPFWTFSMRADSNWQVDIGEYWWQTVTTGSGKNRRTRRVRRTEWYPLAGRHHSWHYHHLVSGSQGLPQAEAQAVFPFQLLEMRRYRPHFLAGWLAEPFSVARQEAREECLRHFNEQEGGRIAAFLPGDTYRDLRWTTTFSEESDDLLLLPFWIGAYTYREKTYRFVLNAQTGRATGTRPVSRWKVGVAVGLALALLIAFFLLAAFLEGS
jgi:hypothetical protein